jgi:hypothetical protein
MSKNNEFNFRGNQMEKWGFSNSDWRNNGVITGNDVDVAIYTNNQDDKKDKKTKDKSDLEQYCIWLECKYKDTDVWKMLAQAVMTALQVNERNRKKLPSYVGCLDSYIPSYIGCFSNSCAAVIEKFTISSLLTGEDTVNLKQQASNLDENTVKIIKDIILRNSNESNKGLFLYDTPNRDEENLEQFGEKLRELREVSRINKNHITVNNFDWIYEEYWLKEVAPLIKFKKGIDEDYRTIDEILPYCYLADLMFDDESRKTLSEKLDVVLQYDRNDNNYKYKDKIIIKCTTGMFERIVEDNIEITDQQQYQSFWNKFKRPPDEEYRNKIIERVDLLVSQDLRERHGDFFTPKVVVDRAVEYLTKTLGSDWQDKYYIWDCCCGTGNLLQDLTHQDRIFASSLKRCHIRLIQTLGRLKNTPSNHLFQMDFLNDDWKPVSEGGKIPNDLWNIIKHQPQNLLIFINPPYAEAGSKNNHGHHSKKNVSYTKTYEEFADKIGAGVRELYIQFLLRICEKIQKCILGTFSTLKFLTSKDCSKFREVFLGEVKNGFIFPSKLFDNITGDFPVGFFIIDLNKKQNIETCEVDIFGFKNEYIGKKTISNKEGNADIVSWLRAFDADNKTKMFGYLRMAGTDMQTQNQIWLTTNLSENDLKKKLYRNITQFNFKEVCIYTSIRWVIVKTWCNNKDRFTAPYFNEVEDGLNKKKHYLYEDDQDFINNCIVYALFTKNNTDWCLFDNDELGLEYSNRNLEVWNLIKQELSKKQLTNEAQEVYNIAKELYIYYHKNKCGKNLTGDVNLNNLSYKEASSWQDVLNAIKGVKVDKSGKASRCTKCEAYPEMRETIEQLGLKLKSLAKKIEEGVYKYGFLR